VLAYDVAFDLVTRHASATVTARVDVAGDCLTIPFRADHLAEVTIDDVPAGGHLADGLLTICGAGYRAGEELAIHASMDVPLATLSGSQVGYSITPAAGGATFYYLMSWIEGCDRFAPCDHRPAAFATYHFHVTHPPGVTVLCPGTISDAGGVTDCVFDRAGGPTYSTFAIAAMTGWTPHALGTWGGVRATIYDEASGATTAKVDAAFEDGFLAWMQARFGAFPYGDEIRVAVAPTYWSGFEHPGNIVLDDALACSGVKCGSPYLHPVTHVLTHELAHQWAGDQTTLADRYDFVWKEAMAEYLAYAYEAEADPPAALATARAWKADAVGARYFPVPTTRPALFDYSGDVYGPGPMILFHQVEALSSRAQVIAALQTLLGTPRAIGVADVEAALASSTGLDLSAYFAAWMTGAGPPTWPELRATWTPAPQPPGGVLRVTQSNASAAGGKTCAFEVELRDSGGANKRRVVVDTFAKGGDQSFAIADPGFTVSSIAIDPDAMCLAYAAPETFAPRPLHAPGWSPWRSRTR
jgi:aminopeptidase N